jgi:signal transduction histidine kinase
MRLTSFRTRVLVLAIVFSIAMVAAVLTTTYVVVHDGMLGTARAETVRMAELASREVSDTVGQAREAAVSRGLTGAAADAAAATELTRELQSVFGVPGFTEGQFAVWDETGALRFRSTADAIVHDAAARRLAASTGRIVEGRLNASAELAGLFGKPGLGTFVVHAPIRMPGDKTWVLDVVYVPTRETATIEAIRPPMTVLSIVAVLVVVFVMQAMMGWVLKLVDDLRKAADSVDAGELGVRLPEEGGHEIGELARSLNNLIDRLRRRADAQTRFVADASHELATPVAGIRGYINILQGWGTDDPAVRDEAIEAIDRESRRMARLTSQLLSMIRSEGNVEFRPVRHDLNATVRQVLVEAATRYAGKRIVFEGPPEGPLMITNDPDRVEEFLSILIDNAGKYTSADGTVSVRTRRSRESMVVDVSDTGPGIPPADLPSIFNRFYRSDASRSKDTGGFGLGLAIAKSIVETCGGEISVASEIGKGTTFTVTLPRSVG